MLMIIQKLRIWHQISSIADNLSFLMKNMQILGNNIKKIFNHSAPYCRESKIQHPTSIVVGTLKYAPGLDNRSIVVNK